MKAPELNHKIDIIQNDPFSQFAVETYSGEQLDGLLDDGQPEKLALPMSQSEWQAALPGELQ